MITRHVAVCAMALLGAGACQSSQEASEEKNEPDDSGSGGETVSSGGTSAPDDSPPHCPDSWIPNPESLGIRCSSSTADCLQECDPESETCPDECISADTTPADDTFGIDCAGCTFYSLVECLEQSGCESEVKEYRCCEAKCLDENCVANQCEREIGSLFTCGLTGSPKCLEHYASGTDGCHPEETGGAGGETQ